MRLISAVRAVDDNSAPARQAALAAVESMYAGDTGFSGGAEPAAPGAVQALLLPDEGADRGTSSRTIRCTPRLASQHW